MIELSKVLNDINGRKTDVALGNGVEPIQGVLLNRRKQIVEALGESDSEFSAIQEEFNRRMEEHVARRQLLEEALGHLDALLQIEGGTVPTPMEEIDRPRDEHRKVPKEAAYEFLSNLGKPLHYKELAQKLAESGVILTGQNPAATLLTKITRDKRFKRAPERGVYGLASWRMSKGQRKSGQAKRRRSRTSRK